MQRTRDVTQEDVDAWRESLGKREAAGKTGKDYLRKQGGPGHMVTRDPVINQANTRDTKGGKHEDTEMKKDRMAFSQKSKTTRVTMREKAHLVRFLKESLQGE